MGEIEPQPVRGDEGALLRDVIAQNLPQRFMQKMRGRMVLPNCITTRVVNLQ
jgi:hypothetical protein